MAANLIYSAGTIGAANSFSTQQKVVFDGTYYWAFYFKSGTANTLFYAYSSDLITWNESSVSLGTVSDQGGYALTVYYDATIPGVMIAWKGASNHPQWIRGSISGTTITWSANNLYISSTLTNAYGYTDIIKGADNKARFLVNSSLLTSTNVISGTFADSPWGASAANAYGQTKCAVYLLGSGNILSIQGGNGTNAAVYALVYSGSWSLPTTVLSSVPAGGQWGSCRISGTSIWVLGLTFSGVTQFIFKKYDGSSWNSKTIPTLPTGSLATNSEVGMATDGTDIWAAVIRGDANNSVSYNKYTVATDSWGGWEDLEASSHTRAYINAQYLNGAVVTTYQQVNGSNYDVYSLPILNNYIFPVSCGTFSETGLDVNLYKDSYLPPDVGTYSETGISTTLNYIRGYSLFPSAGAFVETGNSAGKLIGHSLSPDALSFIETGLSANLVHGSSSYSLAPSTGAFTETGNSATISRNRILSVSSARFVSGFNPTVCKAETGSFTLYGQVALFKFSTEYIGNCRFVLNGKPASLRKGSILRAETKRLSLVAPTTTLEKIAAILAEAYGFIESGPDTELLKDSILKAAVAQFAISQLDTDLLSGTPNRFSDYILRYHRWENGTFNLLLDDEEFLLSGQDVELTVS